MVWGARGYNIDPSIKNRLLVWQISKNTKVAYSKQGLKMVGKRL